MKLGLRIFGRLFVQHFPFEPMFLRKGADAIRRAVRIPVIYIGGVLSRKHMEEAVADGFPFIALGRASIRDANFVKRLRCGEIQESDCDHCNRCIAAMDAGGVSCVSEELGLLS